MQKVKCLVVEDEPIARAGMIKMLGNWSELQVVGEMHCADDWGLTCNHFMPDLVFMDLMLRQQNMLDYLSHNETKPLIIITTAFPQFALRGYEHAVVDYLLKPIEPMALQRAVERAMRLISDREKIVAEDIYIRVNGKYHRIFLDDILCLEAMENYVIVHTPGQRLVTKATMIWFENQLPPSQFIRVHKSWIVNKNRVEVIDKLTLQIKDIVIPVSRENRNFVYAQFIPVK